MEQVKIAINMIIGEFDEPFLRYALDSIKWADEIVIVKTAKRVTLETVTALSLYKTDKMKIIDYFEYEKEFSFADARNLAKRFTEPGGYILKLDADEVYYNSFERTVRSLAFDKDVYEVEFYHMMLDIYHYQYIEGKEVLFKNDPAIQWQGATHETLTGVTSRAKLQDKFIHLGYCKSQTEVFKRWQKYVELENRPDWYDGQDPAHILDDRASVANEFNYEYPEAMREYAKTAPHIIAANNNKLPKLGVVLPVLEQDKKIYDEIQSLEVTADFAMCIILPCVNLAPEWMDRLTETKHTVLNVTGLKSKEVDAVNAGIKYYLDQDADVRWIALAPKDTVFKTPWAKDAVEALYKPGVGVVMTKEAAMIVSVDVFKQIGLLKSNLNKIAAYLEFMERAKQNNIKVTNFLAEA